MEFSAIICEYNPFHNGHLYHIQETKNKTGLPVICIMSGNFVERGEIAIANKYTRASWAIKAGADIVIELPCIFATSSAEMFAEGAVRVLNQVGSVKHLSFGTEDAEIGALQKIADLILTEESKSHKNVITHTKSGLSYKQQMQNHSYLKDYKDIVSKPNNILAIMYLKALKKTHSKILPVSIARTDDGYNSNTPKGVFASASYIRKLLTEGKSVNKFIPDFVTLKNNPEYIKRYHNSILLNIRQKSTDELHNIKDVNEGLEFRIKKCANETGESEKLTENIKTKRYTFARINRILLYSLLGITKEKDKVSRDIKEYIKVLAVNKEKRELLKFIDKTYLLVKGKDYNKLNENQKIIEAIDELASGTYSAITETKYISDKKGTVFI